MIRRTLRLKVRDFSGTRGGNIHEVKDFIDESGNVTSTGRFVIPTIKLIAYGSKTVIDGFTLTNATDNRIVTSTGSTGLNCESGLLYDGTGLKMVTNHQQQVQIQQDMDNYG